MNYPRTRNGYVDDGHLLKQQRACPNCGSKDFKATVSLEHCSKCNYRVDYCGKGGNDVADAYEKHRTMEEEIRQEEIRRKEEALWQRRADEGNDDLPSL